MSNARTQLEAVKLLMERRDEQVTLSLKVLAGIIAGSRANPNDKDEAMRAIAEWPLQLQKALNFVESSDTKGISELHDELGNGFIAFIESDLDAAEVSGGTVH